METPSGKLLRSAAKLAKESGESETGKRLMTMLNLKLTCVEGRLMETINPPDPHTEYDINKAIHPCQADLDTLRYSLEDFQAKVKQFETHGDTMDSGEAYQTLMATYTDIKNRLESLNIQFEHGESLLEQSEEFSLHLEQLSIRINSKVRNIIATILPYAKDTAIQFYNKMMERLTRSQHISEYLLLKFHESVASTTTSQFQSTFTDLMTLFGMDVFLLSQELDADLTLQLKKFKEINQQRKDYTSSMMDTPTTTYAVYYQDLMTQYIVKSKHLPSFQKVRRKHKRVMAEVLQEFTERYLQLDETNDHPATILIQKMLLAWRFIADMYERNHEMKWKKESPKAKKEYVVRRLETMGSREPEGVLDRVDEPVELFNINKSDSEGDEQNQERRRRGRKRRKLPGRRGRNVSGASGSCGSAGPGPSKKEMVQTQYDADKDDQEESEIEMVSDKSNSPTDNYLQPLYVEVEEASVQQTFAMEDEESSHLNDLTEDTVGTAEGTNAEGSGLNYQGLLILAPLPATAQVTLEGTRPVPQGSSSSFQEGQSSQMNKANETTTQTDVLNAPEEKLEVTQIQMSPVPPPPSQVNVDKTSDPQSSWEQLSSHVEQTIKDAMRKGRQDTREDLTRLRGTQVKVEEAPVPPSSSNFPSKPSAQTNTAVEDTIRMLSKDEEAINQLERTLMPPPPCPKPILKLKPSAAVQEDIVTSEKEEWKCQATLALGTLSDSDIQRFEEGQDLKD